jgi:serine O-acetyltransferase
MHTCPDTRLAVSMSNEREASDAPVAGPAIGCPAPGPIAALKADTHRLYGRFSWGRVWAGAFRHRSFRVLVTLRLCQAAKSGGALGSLVSPFIRLAHRQSTGLAGMDLPWSTALGAGIAVPHGWGTVISSLARVGNNVTIFHGVTLGRKDTILPGGREIGFPVIEDDVWIGPHAIIVGGITIGRGSIIAGGALVTRDVPAHSMVMGNPGQVVRSDCLPDVMNPAPF